MRSCPKVGSATTSIIHQIRQKTPFGVCPAQNLEVVEARTKTAPWVAFANTNGTTLVECPNIYHRSKVRKPFSFAGSKVFARLIKGYVKYCMRSFCSELHRQVLQSGDICRRRQNPQQTYADYERATMPTCHSNDGNNRAAQKTVPALVVLHKYVLLSH